MLVVNTWPVGARPSDICRAPQRVRAGLSVVGSGLFRRRQLVACTRLRRPDGLAWQIISRSPRSPSEHALARPDPPRPQRPVHPAWFRPDKYAVYGLARAL